MDQTTLTILFVAAVVGLFAVILILRRERHEIEDETRESPFAASTEGMKVCPKCHRENLWTETHCLYCHSPLRG